MGEGEEEDIVGEVWGDGERWEGEDIVGGIWGEVSGIEGPFFCEGGWVPLGFLWGVDGDEEGAINVVVTDSEMLS